MAELTTVNAYAQALWDVAEELKIEDRILEDGRALVQVLENEPGFMEVLKTPGVAKSDKKELVKNVFQGMLAGEILNLVYLLLDKNRFALYPQIIRQYEKIKQLEKGIVQGCVYSVEPISAERLEALEKETADLLNVKNVRLENRIDKDLIGGVKIYAGEKTVDASVRMKLDKMKHLVLG